VGQADRFSGGAPWSPVSRGGKDHGEGQGSVPLSGIFDAVYQLVRQVPAGHVVTYGQVAAALGNIRLARQVGWAMSACPADVPWHRVVNAQGQISTRPQAGDFCPQRVWLEEEGVRFDPDGRIDLRLYGWIGLRKP